jgi:acyl dehydratase
MSNKTDPGNYFEDFFLGMHITHATPRTVTSGDVSLYTALYGNRFWRAVRRQLCPGRRPAACSR